MTQQGTGNHKELVSSSHNTCRMLYGIRPSLTVQHALAISNLIVQSKKHHQQRRFPEHLLGYSIRHLCSSVFHPIRPAVVSGTLDPPFCTLLTGYEMCNSKDKKSPDTPQIDLTYLHSVYVMTPGSLRAPQP